MKSTLSSVPPMVGTKRRKNTEPSSEAAITDSNTLPAPGELPLSREAAAIAAMLAQKPLKRYVNVR